MTLEKIIELNNLSQYNPTITLKKRTDFSNINKFKYIEVCEMWYADKTSVKLQDDYYIKEEKGVLKAVRKALDHQTEKGGEG